MKHFQTRRLVTIALLLGLVVVPASVAGDEKAPEPKAGDAEAAKPSEDAAKPAAAEPERISGKIYKIDADAKLVGVLVPQGRAFRRYKLILDDKSLILVAGQPSNLQALSEGQEVQVGYFRKGKQDVVDTITVE